MNIKIYNNGNKNHLCLVLHENDTTSLISFIEIYSSVKRFRLSAGINVMNSMLLDVSLLDTIRSNIVKYYDNKISELKSKFKSTNASDYSDEYLKDVMSLKVRIQKVAKRLSECDLEFEDETFGNYLHELYQLKKQLGSFANEYTSDARKINGKIKYDIKTIEAEEYITLGVLDLDILDKILKDKL